MFFLPLMGKTDGLTDLLGGHLCFEAGFIIVACWGKEVTVFVCLDEIDICTDSFFVDFCQARKAIHRITIGKPFDFRHPFKDFFFVLRNTITIIKHLSNIRRRNLITGISRSDKPSKSRFIINFHQTNWHFPFISKGNFPLGVNITIFSRNYYTVTKGIC